MNTLAEKAWINISQKIDPKYFYISFQESPTSYYPHYLELRLNEWINQYRHIYEEIEPILTLHNTAVIDISPEHLLLISQKIVNTVVLYYEGQIQNALTLFSEAMTGLFFVGTKSTLQIEKNTSFYRTRRSEERYFKNFDLFHVPFENRSYVSTARYSIPGFPALYLADSTYTCWEEYGKYRLRDLNFSRFENQEPVNVVNIQLFNDFLSSLVNIDNSDKIALLQNYIVTFPLILACTCKVTNANGHFKPEYIIPQLLLQFVTANTTIDGIKFPSTKINYNNLKNVNSYNYVFPIKQNKPKGYCNRLKEMFQCTEPISLELNEILSNPSSPRAFIYDSSFTDGKSIEIISGIKSNYDETSFGKIESILKKMLTKKVEEYIEVILATYYTNKISRDVTEEVIKKITNNGLKFIVSNDLVNDQGYDYGTIKHFSISYTVNGVEKVQHLREGDIFEA